MMSWKLVGGRLLRTAPSMGGMGRPLRASESAATDAMKLFLGQRKAFSASLPPPLRAVTNALVTRPMSHDLLKLPSRGRHCDVSSCRLAGTRTLTNREGIQLPGRKPAEADVLDPRSRSLRLVGARALSSGPDQGGSESPPPEDGLTRYPNLKSHQGVLRGLDYLGTMVFALSGCITAGNAGMDVLGCTIVATITAVGGGTVRDLLLGNRPVFWMEETEYLWMCLGTAVTVFFTWSFLAEHGIRDDMELLNWADAVGVGAFCIIGAQNGLRKGLSKAVCVSCGMLTATFGGVIRDVLCQRPPRILHSHAEIYASTALAGALMYIQTKAWGLSPVLRVASAFTVAVTLRAMAWKMGIRLPTWTQPPEPEKREDYEEDSAAITYG